MPRGRRFSYRGMEKKAPDIQRHDTGQTEFLMGCNSLIRAVASRKVDK